MDALRASLAEQLAALRGEDPAALSPALLDVRVERIGGAIVVRPAHWEQLRHEEGGAGRPVPYWARTWPSGISLAAAVEAEPPPSGARVLELGCGLALPSVAAARAGAAVLATDGHTDAVAFAAHVLALNDVEAEVAHVDWAEHGSALAERGPWDLVLAADVFYTQANVRAALALLPQLLARGSRFLLADPGRAGARDFLAAARASFTIATRQDGDVTLRTLVRR